jgi:hypothetical protein
LTGGSWMYTLLTYREHKGSHTKKGFWCIMSENLLNWYRAFRSVGRSARDSANISLRLDRTGNLYSNFRTWMENDPEGRNFLLETSVVDFSK